MTTLYYIASSKPRGFQRPLSSLRAVFDFLRRVASSCGRVVLLWAKRHRDRQDALDYLSQDHRAAADMGATREELKAWAQEPFWLS
jgi:hypothetical protein